MFLFGVAKTVAFAARYEFRRRYHNAHLSNKLKIPVKKHHTTIWIYSEDTSQNIPILDLFIALHERRIIGVWPMRKSERKKNALQSTFIEPVNSYNLRKCFIKSVLNIRRFYVQKCISWSKAVGFLLIFQSISYH